MATTIGTLNVQFSANASGFQQGVQSVVGELKLVDSAVTGTVAKLGAIVGGFALVRKAFDGLSFGVQLAAEAEQAQIAFEVMLGSGEKARSLLSELKQFAAATPFEFPELRNAAKMLTAFGVESEGILPTLKSIGDISAGIGNPIGELAELYGKARVQGRLFSQDVNQFTGRGVPLIQELAKQFGIADSEVKKLVEDGKVSFDNLEKAFVSLTSEGGKFFGLMDKQSLSLSGRWSTLADNAKAMATSIGEVLAPAVGAFVEKGISMLEMLKGIDIETARNTVSMVAFVASFAAAITIIPRIITVAGALVAALRSIAGAQALVQALAGPKGWLLLAGSLAIASAAVYAVDSSFTEYTRTLKEAEEAAKRVADSQENIATKAKENAKDSVSALKEDIRGMLAMVDAMNAKMRDKAVGLKDELNQTQQKYEKLRRSLTGGGSIFSAAADINTTEGFAAVQQGNAQAAIRGAIDKLRQQEQEDTSKIESRLRAIEDAIKRAETKVKEVKI